jgi:hypothetical protein
MLGTALLVGLLLPYLGSWLPRANKIEGFGVALSLTQTRNERGSNILQVGEQPTSALGKTARRLSNATSRAHAVVIGSQRKTLTDVKSNMEGFGDLSVMDRDRVYIAYFEHERNAQLGQPTHTGIFSNLNDYVEATKQKLDWGPDDTFLADLGDISGCISIYAEELRDFRLFLVDSHDFLRALLVDVAAQWNREATVPAALTLAAAQPAKESLNVSVAKKLAEQLVAALTKKFGLQPSDVCGSASKLTNKNPSVKGIGKTPYPAYLRSLHGGDRFGRKRCFSPA